MGGVVLMTRAAFEHGAALEIKLHMTAQPDGPHRDDWPGRHDHATTARGGTGIDGPLCCFGVRFHVGAGDTEPAQVEGGTDAVGIKGRLRVHRQRKGNEREDGRM